MRMTLRTASLVCITVFAFDMGLARADLTTGSAPAATDTDHDGVPNHRDLCPQTAQLQKLSPQFTYRFAVSADRYSSEPKAWPVDSSGCEPDSDDDGIVDSQDYCPDDSSRAIAKGVASNGCPVHSDFDGTPDFRDECPGTPRGVRTDASGCPV